MPLLSVPVEVQTSVHNRIGECLAIALKQGITLLRPTVRYDLRGTSSGQALWPANQMRLNPVLLVANKDKYLATTIPHEMAHLLVFHQYGPSTKPHGPEWQLAMQMLGAPVRRGHTYDVSQVRQKPRQIKRTPYHCTCTTHQVTSQRVSKMNRGVVYFCKDCRTELKKGTNPLL